VTRVAAALLAAALPAACAGRSAARPPRPAPVAVRPSLPPALAALAPVEQAAAARVLARRARTSPRPLTRAERTGYAETSRHADVVLFLDTLARLAPNAIRLQTLGTTAEGRAIPLVVASRPAVASPAEAARLGRAVVYVQADIHAGEVEGKEALQMLLRDLALDPGPNLLDSLVLLAAPVYNADGNERVRPQAVNRAEQRGPELVGQRPNARGSTSTATT
jgi:murein tripeptide amidase MpaA